MASPTTPIGTHADHAVIFEWRQTVRQATFDFTNYLHFAVTRSGGWDLGEPSPTFFEFMNGLWTCVHSPWMNFHGTGVLSLIKARCSEVLDYTNVGGQPVPDYGDFCELVDFTGFDDITTSEQTVGYPTDYYPNYVSIYCLKQKDDTPRNINGSLRYGPVLSSWGVPGDPNQLDTTTRGNLQTAMNGMLADFQVTAADGGNVINVQLVIMRKKPAVGMAAPWDFVAIPDRIKVRLGLGTQNTRKKTRNTY